MMVLIRTDRVYVSQRIKMLGVANFRPLFDILHGCFNERSPLKFFKNDPTTLVAPRVKTFFDSTDWSNQQRHYNTYCILYFLGIRIHCV